MALLFFISFLTHVVLAVILAVHQIVILHVLVVIMVQLHHVMVGV